MIIFEAKKMSACRKVPESVGIFLKNFGGEGRSLLLLDISLLILGLEMQLEMMFQHKPGNFDVSAIMQVRVHVIFFNHLQRD